MTQSVGRRGSIQHINDVGIVTGWIMISIAPVPVTVFVGLEQSAGWIPEGVAGATAALSTPPEGAMRIGIESRLG